MYGHGTVSHKGLVYVIGGKSESKYVALYNLYDILSFDYTSGLYFQTVGPFKNTFMEYNIFESAINIANQNLKVSVSLWISHRVLHLRTKSNSI